MELARQLPLDTILDEDEAKAAMLLPLFLRLVNRGPVRGTGTVYTGDSVVEWEFTVDSTRNRWLVRRRPRGVVIGMEDGVRHSAEGQHPTDQAFGADVPSPVKLLFPEHLYIWGRRNDDSRPYLVQQHGPLTILSLVHRDDPAMRGALTYDSRVRAFTRLARPVVETRLDSIRPLD